MFSTIRRKLKSICRASHSHLKPYVVYHPVQAQIDLQGFSLTLKSQMFLPSSASYNRSAGLLTVTKEPFVLHHPVQTKIDLQGFSQSIKSLMLCTIQCKLISICRASHRQKSLMFCNIHFKLKPICRASQRH